MSKWTDEQFDRVARWLDGEQILLSETERELADDFKRGEQVVGDAPAIALPAGVDQRAARRLAAALHGIKFRRRVRIVVMSGVSIAAMIFISLGLFNLMTTGSILSEHDSLAWLFDGGPESQAVWRMPEQDPQLALLVGDLDEIETAMFEPEPAPLPIEAGPAEETDGELEELWRMWIEDHPGEIESLNGAT